MEAFTRDLGLTNLQHRSLWSIKILFRGVLLLIQIWNNSCLKTPQMQNIPLQVHKAGTKKPLYLKKTVYRISSNSFRGNYSFLNLSLCTVTFGSSTYRCGNYSREETIQGRKLYEEIRYLRWLTFNRYIFKFEKEFQYRRGHTHTVWLSTLKSLDT